MMIKKITIVFLIGLMTVAASAKMSDKEPKVLIVFFDGLRPDYITPEAMPNLYAFAQQGAYGKQHHSVFPTVTRVNASAYATGSYPAKTGLMGNTVYFPEVDSLKGLNTGDASELNRITEATHGHLLTATSLGELLKAAGKRMMVFSSGSTGQALLQNHTLSGGAIVNPTMILPETFRDSLIHAIGAIPAHAKPNMAQHQWVTDALIHFGLTEDGPDVSAIWFSDPDGTAHEDGIGSASAMASIRAVDEQFGRILEALKSKHLDDQFNIMISTDHGFVTDIGKQSLTDLLISKGLKKDRSSDDVIVAGGALYVKDHNKEIISKIVAFLQEQPTIGAIFTKGSSDGDTKGWVDGTLSFGAIHWDHPHRTADILVDANWDGRKNGAGYAGASYAQGVAGHGSFSPYEVHIALLAGGPGFKENFESDLPTANVDIVPTVLHLLKLPVPKEMDGRVVEELLKEQASGTFPLQVKTESIVTEVKRPWGTYKLTLHRSLLGKYSYTDYTTTERIAVSSVL